MKTSIIKQRLAKNEPAFATTLHLNDPFAYELASTLGVEGIWLDMEHRPFTLDSAARMMIAARAGGDTDVIVRVSRARFGPARQHGPGASRADRVSRKAAASRPCSPTCRQLWDNYTATSPVSEPGT